MANFRRGDDAISFGYVKVGGWFRIFEAKNAGKMVFCSKQGSGDLTGRW
jgi:hypothetical protein